jgi:hypothetical protein
MMGTESRAQTSQNRPITGKRRPPSAGIEARISTMTFG